MKELSSLAEVEGALRAEGFFEGGADGLVADVYLGYGLSAAIRRDGTPLPAELCPLPVAAVQIRHVPVTVPWDSHSGMALTDGGAFEIGSWSRTWTDAEYGAAVEAVREAIAAGD